MNFMTLLHFSKYRSSKFINCCMATHYKNSDTHQQKECSACKIFIMWCCSYNLTASWWQSLHVSELYPCQEKGKINVMLFFCLGFISLIFMIHKTPREGRGYLFKSSHQLHRHLHINKGITAGSSPLHIASSQTSTKNLWVRFQVQVANHNGLIYFVITGKM